MTSTREYIDRLIRDSALVELRHQSNGRWHTVGYFDSTDSLLDAARRLHKVGNLFTSLHRPRVKLLDAPIRNDDVARFTRLLFDSDPVREINTPSTADELAFAHKSADDVQKVLTAMGWPEPARAMSGNGVHLQYRVALPNDDIVKHQLKVIYAGLKSEYSNQHVDFDAKVRNPGRICTLYGSVKRKGEATPGRPHRKSLIEIPADWRQVPRKNIEGLAKFYTQKQKAVPARQELPAAVLPSGGSGDYASLDIVAWFQSHGLYEHHIEDHIHAVTCPWEGGHSESNHNDTTVYANDTGWPQFHCQHSSCEGRKIADVMSFWGDADRFCSRQFTGGKS